MVLVQTYNMFADRVRRSDVARGALSSLSVRIYGAAIAYLTQLYLARSIGAEQLGVYVFAWTWLSVLAFLTPLGFETSLVRYIASYTAEERWGELRGVLAFGARVTLFTSLAVTLVGCSFVYWGGSSASPYGWALCVAFCCVPILAFVNLHEGIAKGFTWIWQVSLPNYGIRPSLFLIFSILAISMLKFATGVAIVAAMLLACVCTLIVQFSRYRKLLPAPLRSVNKIYATRDWIRVSIPMLLVVSFELMLANTDIIMLGLIDGPVETGVYSIAVRTSGVLLFIFFAVSAFAAPKIARFKTQHQIEELLAFSRKVRFWTFMPTLLGIALLALFGRYILAFFGADFAHAYTPMMILSLGIALRTLAGPVDNLMSMTGKQDQLAMAMAGVMMLNIVANWLLIPKFGMQGASMATVGSVVVELLIVSMMASRHIGYRIFMFRQ